MKKEGMKMDNNILTILTSEDKEDIRVALKDIIIERIKDDFEAYNCFIFDPDELDTMIQDAVEEAKAEIKPMVKEFMFNEMKNKLGLK